MGRQFEVSYIEKAYCIKQEVMRSASHFLKVRQDFDADDNTTDDKED